MYESRRAALIIHCVEQLESLLPVELVNRGEAEHLSAQLGRLAAKGLLGYSGEEIRVGNAIPDVVRDDVPDDLVHRGISRNGSGIDEVDLLVDDLPPHTNIGSLEKRFDLKRRQAALFEPGIHFVVSAINPLIQQASAGFSVYPVHEVRLHDVKPGIAVSVLIGGAVVDDVGPKSIYSLALCIRVPDAKHRHLELVEHGSHSLVALRVDRVLQRELPIALVLDGHNSVEVNLDGAAVLRDVDLEHLRRRTSSKRDRCIGDRSIEVLDLRKGENVSPRCRVALADAIVCHIVHGITNVDHGLRLVDVRAGSLGILTSEHHALLKVLIG